MNEYERLTRQSAPNMHTWPLSSSAEISYADCDLW